MKSAIALVVFLGLAGGAFASGCPNTPKYSLGLKLSCQGDEPSFNWPNYENVAQFYSCQGLGRPLLLNCEPGKYFCFVMQACLSCSEYFPSMACDKIPKANSSSCYAIDGGSTEPTPIYPTTPTASTAGTTTKTTAQPTTKTTKPTTATTKPTVPEPTGGFPPAPSPSTVNPNVPTPPTAPPTPPPVEAKPPTIIVPGY